MMYNVLNHVLKAKRASAVALFLALGITAAPLSTGLNFTAEARAEGPQSVADLAERLKDAVVNISTSTKIEASKRPNLPVPELPEGSPFQDFFDEFFKNDRGGSNNNRPRNAQSLGSGFVVDAEGIIITNNHVIADADEITVNFTDGSKLIAELVGTDPKTDIAVLKVKPKAPLKAVAFGDSTKTRVGEWVMAIGNPFGYSGTVTLGIVSATNRDINAGPYDNFIQTDASINRGNSGGPLFNMDGDVIGINTAIISPSGGSIGLGFSVPSELASRVVAQLVEFGETRRGWLGIAFQQITDEIAESLDLDGTKGALVASVAKDGPAEKGGIVPGDIILKFNGKTIDDSKLLPRIVADTSIGEKVEVLVLRKGKEVVMNVELGRLEDFDKANAAEKPKAKEEEKPMEMLGLTMGKIDQEAIEQFKLKADMDGVVISDIDPNSAAAEKNLRPGDVIVEVGQEVVKTPQDVEDRINTLKKEGKKNALLLISSNDQLRFVVLRIDE